MTKTETQKNIRNAFILAKIELNLPLTAKERSIYLLYIATTQEASEFLKREKGGNL